MDLPTTSSPSSSSSSSSDDHAPSSLHGWQKVTNPKKAKRLDAAAARSKSKTIGSASSNSPDAHVFLALEKEAEEKRAHREALLLSLQREHAAVTDSARSDSDLDEDADEAALPPHSDGLPPKKSKAKKPKKPKVTVAEAAAAIDPADLASFLTHISESYGELPDVQLMRFADYFGRAFNQVTTTQFGWNKILKESSISKAVEVPLCYIKESVVKTSYDWLAGKPANALSEFVLWGLTDLVNDMQVHQNAQKGSKGSPAPSSRTKIGILVVLALTLRNRPEVLLHKAAVLRTNLQFQGHEKLLMMAWTYGQVAQGDLVVGMQIWVQNLLPLACGKASTPGSRDITLQFAENILFNNIKKAQPVLLNGAAKKGERLVPPIALHLFMQATFPSDAARTKATDRFQEIYPLVKELALAGPKKSKATKPVAQQLLPLCLDSACEDVPSLINEACDLFIWCLSQNNDCFKQWEKLHLEKLKGSVNILKYMCDNWKVVINRIHPLDELKSAISIVIAKNHAALQNSKSDPKLDMTLKVAERHATTLRRRLLRSGPCFKAMATLVAGVGIAYGCYLLKFDLSLVR